ncbi:hypothetical protein VTO73DRAFT_9060 [Trametes versicolor]
MTFPVDSPTRTRSTTLPIPRSTSSVNTGNARSLSNAASPTNTSPFASPSHAQTALTPDRPVTTLTIAPVSALTSTAVTTSTPAAEINVSGSPITSHSSADSLSTSSLPSTSSISSPLQPLVPIATSGTPSRRVSRIPTSALAGVIVSAVLATAIAAVLLRFWLRRRRARARAQALHPAQNGAPGTSTGSLSSATIPVVRSRWHVFSKAQADENSSVPENRSRAHSLVAGSSDSTRYGSAASLEPPPSSRPLLAVHADHKDVEHYGRELPRPSSSFPVPPSLEHQPERPGEPSDIHAACEGAPAVAHEPGTADGHTPERFLQLTLPWAFGQRVLAMMACEDANSVGSDGSESLPAYEPRRSG